MVANIRLSTLSTTLFIIVSIMLLSACSSGPIQKPTVSVRYAEISQLSFTQSSAVFTIRVDNPNAFPIYLSGVDYGLSLNGHLVAEGSNNASTKIPAGGSKRLDMPIKIRVAEILTLIPSFIKQGQVKYDLAGKVRTPLIALPFKHSGGAGVDN